MTRSGMVNLVAERLELSWDQANAWVDVSVPPEAYSAEGYEIPADDVELWLDRIREDLE